MMCTGNVCTDLAKTGQTDPESQKTFVITVETNIYSKPMILRKLE